MDWRCDEVLDRDGPEVWQPPDETSAKKVPRDGLGHGTDVVY